MKALILFLLLSVTSHAKVVYEIRTHDLRNPFDKSYVKIVDEGKKSWKFGDWTPLVGITAKPTDNASLSDIREGTGFVIGRYKDVTTSKTGFLILTDLHVLAKIPVLGSRTKYPLDHNLKVTFFNQETRESVGDKRSARVVGMSPFSDLAIIEVEADAAELSKVTLPALAIMNPKGMEQATWRPYAFRIKPGENRAGSSNYNTIDTDYRSEMTTPDKINPLSLTENTFWYIQHKYAEGMSGGPLFGRDIKDKNGEPLQLKDINGADVNLNDAVFGALGFIFDLYHNDGYAYPLNRFFIQMVSRAATDDFSEEEFKLNSQNDTEMTLLFGKPNYGQSDLKIKLSSPTVVATVTKKTVGSDSISLVVKSEDSKTNARNRVTFVQEIVWENKLAGKTKSGMVGATTQGRVGAVSGSAGANSGSAGANSGSAGANSGSAGANSGSAGANSGSAGANSGSAGANSGSAGGNSGSAGGNSGSAGANSGSAGAVSSLNPPKANAATYSIFVVPEINYAFFPWDRPELYSIVIPGQKVNSTARHLKDVFDYLRKFNGLGFNVDTLYSKHQDSIRETLSDIIDDPQVNTNINIINFLKAYTNINTRGITLKSVNGRFSELDQSRNAVSGQVNFQILESSGKLSTVSLVFSMIQTKEGWNVLKQDLLLDDTPIQANFENSDIVFSRPFGKPRFTLFKDNKALGLISP